MGVGKEGQRPMGNRQWPRKGGKMRSKTDPCPPPKSGCSQGCWSFSSQSLVKRLLEGTPILMVAQSLGTASFRGRAKDSGSMNPTLVASAVNELAM